MPDMLLSPRLSQLPSAITGISFPLFNLNVELTFMSSSLYLLSLSLYYNWNHRPLIVPIIIDFLLFINANDKINITGNGKERVQKWIGS